MILLIWVGPTPNCATPGPRAVYLVRCGPAWRYPHRPKYESSQPTVTSATTTTITVLIRPSIGRKARAKPTRTNNKTRPMMDILVGCYPTGVGAIALITAAR